MELYVPRLLPPHLFFLILTASLFPCSLCFDAQYQYCQNTSKCGAMNIAYPFGLGNRGCGLPSLQIDCVLNSTLVIEIQGQNYTILDYESDAHSDMFPHPRPDMFPHPSMTPNPHPDRFPGPDRFPHPDLFAVVRGEKCKFLDDPINRQIPPPEHADNILRIGRQNWTLNVYKCDKQGEIKNSEMPPGKCNATVYYSFFDNWNSTQGCSKEQATVDVGFMKLDFNDNSIKSDCQSCESCHASRGICGYNTSDSTAAAPFVCYCTDRPRTDKCPGHGQGNNSTIRGPGNKSANTGRGNKSVIIIIGCSVGGAALIAVLLLAHYMKNREPPPRGDLPRHLPGHQMGDLPIFSGHEMGNLPIFSYEALRQSTNCFHEENELGFGGFGSVYLGKLWDGRTVAVKRLYQDNSRRLEQFINEVQIFSILNHPHVVRLYGCTPADSPELLLVYEFVPNGTLADHLHGDRKNPKGIPWNTRLNIAIQTAQALAFLHDLDPPIFHRDVKSSNILLDEILDVKLADFGLCRLLPVDASHVTTLPQGTPGYVDPEYYQCYQLTDKSDVYSFGVVLVEIISAKIAMDINRNKREINLANLALTKIHEGALQELVDPQLEIEMNYEVREMVSAVAELAFRCLASERDDRPHMKEVVAELEEIRTSKGPGEAQLGLFSKIKQPNTVPLSPISVQDKWPSMSSASNTSP